VEGSAQEQLDLPPAAQSAVDWLPGSAMLQLFILSQAGEAFAGLLRLNASVLLLRILALAIVLAWRVRRMER